MKRSANVVCAVVIFYENAVVVQIAVTTNVGVAARELSTPTVV